MNNKYRITVLFFSIIFVLFLLSCEKTHHPKDSELIANFQVHQEEFAELLQMFEEDKSLGRVSFDFTRLANFFEKCESQNSWNGKNIDISEGRLLEYKKLFSELKLEAGIEGYCEKDEIYFHASTIGLAVSGSSKGYVFMLKKPMSENVVESLDDYKPNGKESTLGYKHIEGNWYLYYYAD